MLFVFDEASGIADEIYQACLGALTGEDNKLILCSNPTKTSGFFYDAFHSQRDSYTTLKVSCADSDKVSAEYIQHMIDTYGEDSDVVRVRVLGEFPKSDSDGLIALEQIEQAHMREPELEGDLVLGVDIARFGDDETCAAVRVGKTLTEIHSWRKLDLMTTAGKIKLLAQGLEKKYKQAAKIFVDETGLGGGVVDRLREQGVNVTGINFGSRARDDEHYQNRVAEMYFALRDRFVTGDIILAVEDERLAAELSTRKYSCDSRGRLCLERKDDYKKRLGRSPDRADALALCFISEPAISLPSFSLQRSYWLGH